MSRLAKLPERDLEQISMYVDRQMTADDRRAFEARLVSDPELRQAVEEMRGVVAAVRGLGELRVPRNFTLTEAAAGRRRTSSYTYLRLATALATALFFLTSGLRLVPASLGPMAASAPQLEAALEAQDFAQEAGAQAPFAEGTSIPETPQEALRAAVPSSPSSLAPLPTPSPAGTACVGCAMAGAEAPAAAPAPTAEVQASGEVAVPAPKAAPSPVLDPLVLMQLVLGVSAILLLAITLRARTR